MLRAPLAGPSKLLTAPLQTTASNMPGPEVHIHECHDTWQGLRMGQETALVRSSPAVQRVAHANAHSLLFLHPLGQTSESTMNSASEENEPTTGVDYGAAYGLPFGLQIHANSRPLDASNVPASASEGDESAAFHVKGPSQPLLGNPATAKHGQQRRPSNTGGVDQPHLVTLQRYMPYSTDPKSGFAATAAPKPYLQRLEPLVPHQLPPYDQLPQRFLPPQPQRQRQQLVLLQRISPRGGDDAEGGSLQQDMYVRAAVLPPAYTNYYGEAADGLCANARPLYLQPVGFEQGSFDQGPQSAGRDLTDSPDPEEQLRQRSFALQMQYGPATTAPYLAKDETESKDLQGEATVVTKMQPDGAQRTAAAATKVESSSEAAAIAAAAAGPSALKVEVSDCDVAPCGVVARSRKAAEGAADNRGGAQGGMRMAPDGGTAQADMKVEAAATSGCQFWDLAALAEVACRASELDREERCAGDRKGLVGNLGSKDKDGDAYMSDDDLSESYSARCMDRDRDRDQRTEMEGGHGGVGGRAWRARKPPPVNGGSNGTCGNGGGKNDGGCSASLPVTVPHTDRKNPKVLAPRSGRVGDTKHLVLPAEIVQALPEAMLDGQEPVHVLALMPAMPPGGPEGSSPREPQPSRQQYQKADITCHVGNGPGGFPALHLPVIEAVYGRPVRRFTLHADLVLELELGMPVVRVPRGGGGGKRTATECESGDSDSAATGTSNGEILPPDSKACLATRAGTVAKVHSLPTTLVREGVWEQTAERGPSPRPASMLTSLHQPPACPRVSDDADGSCVTGINMMQQGINSCGPANVAGCSAGPASGAGAGAAATAGTGKATPVAAAGAAMAPALAPASVSRRGRGGSGGATGPGLPITVRRPLTGKPTVMRSCTGAVGSKKHLPLPQEIIKAMPVEQVSGVEPVQVAVVIVPPTAAGSAAAAEHIAAQQQPLERLLCTIGPTGSHGCTALQVPVSRGMNGRRLVYIKLRTDLELELGLGDVVAMIPPRPRSITANTNGGAAMATAASGAASDTVTAGAAVAMPGRTVDPTGGAPPYKRHCSSINAVGNAVGEAGSAASAAAAAAAAAVASANGPSPAMISNFASAVAAAAAAAGSSSWSAAPGIRVLGGVPSDGDAGVRHQQHQQLNQPLLASGQHNAHLTPPPPVLPLSQLQQRAPVRSERIPLEGGDAAEPPETPFTFRAAVPLPAASTEAGDARGSPSPKRDAIAVGSAAAAPAAAAAAAAVTGATSSRQSTVDGAKAATVAAANASAGAAEAVAQAASILGRVWALLRQVPRVQLVATRVLAAVRQRPAEGGGDRVALLAGFRGCLGGILNLLNNAREAAAADAAAGQQAAGAGLFRGGDVRVCRCLLAAAPTMLSAAECLLEWYSLLAEVQDEGTAVSYAIELGSSAALVKAQLAEELAPLLTLQGLMS